VIPVVAIENFLVAAMTVFALALTVIALLAWKRTRDFRLLFLGASFALFSTKGVVLTLVLFLTPMPLPTLVVIWGAFDLAILASFYGFTLRR